MSTAHSLHVASLLAVAGVSSSTVAAAQVLQPPVLPPPQPVAPAHTPVPAHTPRTLPPSQSEKFAMAGNLAISVERLMGYYRSQGSLELEKGGNTLRIDETNHFVSVLTPSNSEYGAEVSGIARVAVDYFVRDEMSLGMSVGYTAHSGDFELDSSYLASNDDSYDEFSAYLAGARVGYASRLTPYLGIWPRMGFFYSFWKLENPRSGDQATGSLQTLNLETLLVLLANPSFGAHFGVTYDLSLVGTQATDNSAGRADYVIERETLGIVAGVTGLL